MVSGGLTPRAFEDVLQNSVLREGCGITHPPCIPAGLKEVMRVCVNSPEQSAVQITGRHVELPLEHGLFGDGWIPFVLLLPSGTELCCYCDSNIQTS